MNANGIGYDQSPCCWNLEMEAGWGRHSKPNWTGIDWPLEFAPPKVCCKKVGNSKYYSTRDDTDTDVVVIIAAPLGDWSHDR